jgi:hypothetical protein
MISLELVVQDVVSYGSRAGGDSVRVLQDVREGRLITRNDGYNRLTRSANGQLLGVLTVGETF